MPKKAKYAGKISAKLKPEQIKAITPPAKKARKLPLYDFRYKGSNTNTDATTTINKSVISKYAPIISAIAINPAEIADNDITLLFIIYNYNTYCTTYSYNTLLSNNQHNR